MSGSLKLRPGVVAAKQWLATERQKLREQHDSGSPGIQVCTRLTEMLQSVVLSLFQSAVSDFPQHAEAYKYDVALVALGGFGRADVAPYSDVDLMLLHNQWTPVEPLAKRLMHDLYDAGLAVGQSVRTTAEAAKLALQDATIFTALRVIDTNQMGIAFVLDRTRRVIGVVTDGDIRHAFVRGIKRGQFSL